MNSTNSTVLKQYETSIINKYRPMTVQNHICLMRMLLKGVNDKPVGEISREDIEWFLEHESVHIVCNCNTTVYSSS